MITRKAIATTYGQLDAAGQAFRLPFRNMSPVEGASNGSRTTTRQDKSAQSWNSRRQRGNETSCTGEWPSQATKVKYTKARETGSVVPSDEKGGNENKRHSATRLSDDDSKSDRQYSWLWDESDDAGESDGTKEQKAGNEPTIDLQTQGRSWLGSPSSDEDESC